MQNPDSIKQLIEGKIPNSVVQVQDMTGTQDHFEIEVVSSVFEGQSLIDRHRMLHQILEKPMEGDIHAVKFRTFTPTEKKERKRF